MCMSRLSTLHLCRLHLCCCTHKHRSHNHSLVGDTLDRYNALYTAMFSPNPDFKKIEVRSPHPPKLTGHSVSSVIPAPNPHNTCFTGDTCPKPLTLTPNPNPWSYRPPNPHLTQNRNRDTLLRVLVEGTQDVAGIPIAADKLFFSLFEAGAVRNVVQLVLRWRIVIAVPSKCSCRVGL